MTIQRYMDSFPSNDRIFNWIEEMCRLPHRRTGTPEGMQSAQYLSDQFQKIGLSDIRIEEVNGTCFDPIRYELNVDNADYPAFVINGTLHKKPFGIFETGEECVETEIIYLGEGRSADFEDVDVAGKIVMCDCPWFDMDECTYAEEWCSEQAIIYDPDADKRQPLRKTDSYSPNSWPYNYITAQKKGAAGFIGVLNDFFEDGINWSEDYEEIGIAHGCDRFQIPGLWIGITAADKIKKTLTDNSKATMKVKVNYFEGKARNVVGVLPGKTDEIILVHSHHDAVFTGAVQDASGMSEVLALADFFSSVPEEMRKKTMLFAGFDGHYTDYAGHKAFVNQLKTSGRKIVADVVIEHIGKDVGIDEDNRPVVREEPDIRLLYVSKDEGLVKEVDRVVRDGDLRRTIIMPIKDYVPPENGLYEFQSDEVISDAYYSHLAGFPIVSMLSPQMYLFHPMDTPDMIPKGELAKVGKAFAEIIDYLFTS